MFTLRTTILTAAVWVLAAQAAAAQTKLLRFPDLHGDELVFTYGGDLWLAPAGGGTARRLTAHPGLELFAKFSPDGRWIAFTGQYDGDEQVYVMPAAGGSPRQLTFYPAAGPLPPRWGYDNQVYGWTPDGQAVLFRSMRDGWDLSDTRLYTVGLDGGTPVALPMPESGGGTFAPDGRRVVYSPTTRDFRHWKRYQGGWAQDLYVFDLETWESERVTDHPRTDRDPMWIGETIYFSSDRDGKLNLYAYDPASRETAQLTGSTTWDVRWPSAGDGERIVYESGGELEILDLAAGESRRVAIRVPDDGVARRPSRVAAGRLITGFGLAPEGKRALFAARGDVFTAPIEHGAVRNLTRTSGANDREPAWSPDGKWVAFVSDSSGEEEVYRVEQTGRGEPERLTDLASRGLTGRFTDLAFSPDGKLLAFQNQQGKLLVLEIESRELTEVADDVAFGLTYDWSPRGGFLAYTLTDPNGFRSIHVWSAADGKSRRVTDELWNDFGPSWDPKGDYLFYLSDREFGPQVGSFEFNYVADRETFAYALALRQDVEHPFPPRSDEVEVAEDGKKDGEKSEKGEKGGKKRDEDEDEDEDEDGEGEKDAESRPLVIEFEGLAQRVARVPVVADNYLGIVATEGQLVLARGFAPYYGRESDRTPELVAFDFESREEKQLASGLQGLAVSPDRTKFLIRAGGNYQLVDAKGGKNGAKTVSTAGLEVDRVPAEEWAQIFGEVWRRFRDFFYDPGMHGYDWEALREQYRPLLEHVAHRSDLTYVLTEMISELSVSHAYVAGGDYEIPERPRAALLGARFELDAEAGRYRVAEILAGHNEEPRYRSPLTEVGIGVAVGDYVLAINGVELTAGGNPYRLLRHAGAGAVELTVSGRPALDGARQVRVEPIDDEDPLLYLKWIERNRREVAERTDGRVGYLHLPNMSAQGIREWIKWFYGQIRNEGLVIDVRSNGGGNVSPMIIERLRRELLMVDFERNIEVADTYPGTVFHGHLACLLDEDTASDGDQFAYVFRRAGLGPLVGKRSWGGVVGIYGRDPLIDGGAVSVPEAGSADPDGNWVIEGHGVDPDYVVENDPKSRLEGRDLQLEKAVELVMERIEADPKRLPERPPGPVKTQ